MTIGIGARPQRALLSLRAALAGVWLFASLLALMPVAIVAGLIDRRQRIYGWTSRVWARGILFLMGARVTCQMRNADAGDEAYVVVANHQGLLDIPALIVAFSASMPIRFVAKQSLYSIPVLGWGMRVFGHVELDYRTAGAALLGLRQAQRAIGRGWSVVFFAEGTRTRDGGIGAFKKGAFHTAASVGARVLPVTISGSWETLPRNRVFPLRRGTIRIEAHAPLVADGTGAEQLQMAADACRKQIARGLPPTAREVVA